MKTTLLLVNSWIESGKALLAVSLLLLMITLSGCSQYYYFNASQNVNAFQEKGDVYVSLGMDANQGVGSVGYAFTDNIGVIGSLRGFNPSETDTTVWSTNNNHNNNNNSNNNTVNYNNWMVEPELALAKSIELGGMPGSRLAGSLNFGYAFAPGIGNKDFFSMNMNRLALQPALCYTTDYFDIGLSARFSRLNYNLTVYQTPPAELELGDAGKQLYSFIEPAITVGGGYKFFKLRVQYLLARNQTDASLRYLSESIYISLNLNFNARKPSE